MFVSFKIETSKFIKLFFFKNSFNSKYETFLFDSKSFLLEIIIFFK